jgi:hypothetical protein
MCNMGGHRAQAGARAGAKRRGGGGGGRVDYPVDYDVLSKIAIAIGLRSVLCLPVCAAPRHAILFVL